MRLISARVRGYGRIVDSKVNLDAKVIAIVGPNEAGKTTLLKALSHVDGGGAVPVSQRSRAAEVTDETQTTQFDYVLDQSDHDALEDLDLHELPTRAKVARTASGDRLTVDLKPRPIKSVAVIATALGDLRAAQAAESLDEWIDPETIYADPHSDAARDYRTELQSVVDAVDGVAAEPGTDPEEGIVETAQALLDATLAETDAEALRQALQAVIEWSHREDPAQAARNRIWKRFARLHSFR
jgi:energy-coupling factor transporter ATP-binding protein EcfA2